MYFSIRRSLAVALGTAAVLFAPAAFAAGAYHPANGEAGATFHPEHAASKSRDHVGNELAAATQHPAWQTAISRGAPWPVAKSGPGLTREQVSAELQAAMKHPAWDRVSRGGAPWPTPALAAVQSSAK
ncbi:DUF4148 domain-containing protein [Xenophilus aerolatus]